MYTLIYVINSKDRQYECGYQLTRNNLYHAPNGKIHIARFDICFDIQNGLGYIGDIYMRSFIRGWKNKIIIKKKRKISIWNTILYLSNSQLCNDLLYIICSYL
jgi:hypothetical protein